MMINKNTTARAALIAGLKQIPRLDKVLDAIALGEVCLNGGIWTYSGDNQAAYSRDNYG
tara:strand:+ start:12881 stop:13057 length:177 start_codon:yes stop_codon:yes gene_type:complete